MSEDMRQEDTNMKFKNLPQKEQEGYVINYTDPIKIKIYLLCYQNVEKAINKLKRMTKMHFPLIQLFVGKIQRNILKQVQMTPFQL